MFHESKVLLINKVDLLPYVDCSVDKIRQDALRINPNLDVFEISCKNGEGLEPWYDWLRNGVRLKKPGKKEIQDIL
jgi:hydrogenase nickel incorporation protein HypB